MNFLKYLQKATHSERKLRRSKSVVPEDITGKRVKWGHYIEAIRVFYKEAPPIFVRPSRQNKKRDHNEPLKGILKRKLKKDKIDEIDSKKTEASSDNESDYLTPERSRPRRIPPTPKPRFKHLGKTIKVPLRSKYPRHRDDDILARRAYRPRVELVKRYKQVLVEVLY